DQQETMDRLNDRSALPANEPCSVPHDVEVGFASVPPQRRTLLGADARLRNDYGAISTQRCPVAPVRLLADQEQPAVQAAYLSDHRGSEQPCDARNEVHLVSLAPRFLCRVCVPQHPGPRAEGAAAVDPPPVQDHPRPRGPPLSLSSPSCAS